MSSDNHRGNRIKELRDTRGWSQQQAADAIGVRREMWTKYEAGAEPGAKALTAMAAAGFDVAYVLVGRHSFDRPGLSNEEVDQFRRLIDLFWSASDESRKSIFSMLSALHAQDVQKGTARGVRKVKAAPDTPPSSADTPPAPTTKPTPKKRAPAKKAAPATATNSAPGGFAIGNVESFQSVAKGDIHNDFSGRKKR